MNSSKLKFILIFNCCIFFCISPSKSQKNVERDKIEVIEPDMVLVKGGTFSMGCMDGDERCKDIERPIHSVKLPDFYIGKYEVTEAQWESVMEDPQNLWKNRPDYPVTDIINRIAIEYCQKLSKLTGKTYRLPTEAEWEYAAKGGNKSKNYIYAGSNDVEEVAWYKYNSNNKCQPVGKKKANELGLYDMSGNVAECVSDVLTNYPGSSMDANNEHSKITVEKGGGWHSDTEICRNSDRSGGIRSHGWRGFRVVMVP